MSRNNALTAIMIVVLIMISTSAYSQKPFRVGTTAANFLEIGIGAVGNAMGDAMVAHTSDMSSIYWNPAGLAYMEKSEAMFMHQPWVVDISHTFTGVGLVLPGMGTIGLGLSYMGYGDMEVTSMELQEGTGENFTANDFAVNLSFSRRLVQWFAFGASAKFISSSIWHTNASAMALDLGVIVSTQFFSPTGNREDGMKIGMSISNYGGRMKYDGMDLMNPIDIAPNEEGNYRDTPGQFRLSGWELPLIFRIGVAVKPIVMGNHKVTVAIDALHPNNNGESINAGAEYQMSVPSFGEFFLRGGYKALGLKDSEFGPTFGGGLVMRVAPTLAIKVDYAYRSVGLLGNIHCYTFGVMF